MERALMESPKYIAQFVSSIELSAWEVPLILPGQSAGLN